MVLWLRIEFVIRMSNPGKSCACVLGCFDGALGCICGSLWTLLSDLKPVWPAYLR